MMYPDRENLMMMSLRMSLMVEMQWSKWIGRSQIVYKMTGAANLKHLRWKKMKKVEARKMTNHNKTEMSNKIQVISLTMTMMTRKKKRKVQTNSIKAKVKALKLMVVKMKHTVIVTKKQMIWLIKSWEMTFHFQIRMKIKMTLKMLMLSSLMKKMMRRGKGNSLVMMIIIFLAKYQKKKRKTRWA